MFEHHRSSNCFVFLHAYSVVSDDGGRATRKSRLQRPKTCPSIMIHTRHDTLSIPRRSRSSAKRHNEAIGHVSRCQ